MKTPISILLFLLTAEILFSQNTGIVVYEPFNVKDSVNQATVIKIDKNCLKWNISLLGRGCFAFDYERLLSQALTMEFEAGITYRDLIFESIFESESSDIYDYSDNSDNVRLGYIIGADLRFYPTEGDFEGLYISPMLRYRFYQSEKEFDLNDKVVTFSNDYNMSDVGFIVGCQRESDYSEVLWDWFFGVSFRRFEYKDFSEVYEENSYDITGYESKDKKMGLPAIICGFKVGFTL